MFQKIKNWLNDFFSTKCELCGQKDLRLYSDGVGILACNECWNKVENGEQDGKR